MFQAAFLVMLVIPHARTDDVKTAAEFAQLGEKFLAWNEVAQARQFCERALQLDPSGDAPADCLRDVIAAEDKKKASEDKEKVVAEIAEAQARRGVQQYDKEIGLLSGALVLAHERGMVTEEKQIRDLLEDAEPSLSKSSPGVDNRLDLQRIDVDCSWISYLPATQADSCDISQVAGG